MKQLPPRVTDQVSFVAELYALFVDGAPYQLQVNTQTDEGDPVSFNLPAMSRDQGAVEAMKRGLGKGEVKKVTVLLFLAPEKKQEESRIIVPGFVPPREVLEK